MSLTNLSQVLLRNNDLLKANSTLLINMPADTLSNELRVINPESEISLFTSNFELYQQYQSNNYAQGKYFFDSFYQSSNNHDLIIIQFPKSKLELKFTLAMLASCTNEDSRILVVGENKSGIKSIEKLTKGNFTFCAKVDSARHCLLVEAQLIKSDKSFSINDWFNHYQVEVNNVQLKVAALPGVFSQAKLDAGTALLLETLSEATTAENEKVLDFGCGAGVIASFIGLKNPSTTLHLADVSALALTSAQETLKLNGLDGKVFPTNSLSNITEKYQHIISNPPFHLGIKTHYVATEQFLHGIKPHLIRGGTLTIVANSFLQYQDIIEGSLGHTKKLCKRNGFTIYQAHRSIRATKSHDNQLKF